MTDFAGTWNKQFPAERRASVIAGLTASGINNYLQAHRKHDPERYIVQREFKDGELTKLKLSLVVGGDLTEHGNGTAKPLTVAFPTSAPASVSHDYRAMYDFSDEEGPSTPDPLAQHLPNVVISVKDLNLYMEWPNSEGGAWEHHQGGIDLDLEARLDLVEEDGRCSLSFIPVKLHVNRASEAALRMSMAKAIAAKSSGAIPSTTDPKIADLIMAVVELAATTVGPDLARNIVIPVFEFDKFDATPTGLALSNGMVSVAAHLDFTRALDQAKERIQGLRIGLMDAFELDLAAAGGGMQLLFDPDVLKKAEDLPPQEQWEFLSKQTTRTEEEIEALLVHSRSFADAQLRSLHAEMKHVTSNMAPAIAEVAKAAQPDFGIAINQETLNRLVAEVGGINRQGYTRDVSLIAIRGRLGYQVNIGTPFIDVTSGGALQGKVDIDVFAGLYYQLRRWNGRWGKNRRVGLGVKGDPKLTIQTRRSNGLSILAQIDLNGLGIQTGLGSIIDKLINILISPFKKAVELILNGILALLSFVVVPARFAIPGQRTGVLLSQFDTAQYLRHEANDQRNKFLLVQCDMNGGKLS